MTRPSGHLTLYRVGCFHVHSTAPSVCFLSIHLTRKERRMTLAPQEMATSTYLRRMNQRRVIESVARMRRVSRAELARIAGMSQPTVSRIVDDLLARGILMEGDSDQAVLDSANGGAARRAASVGRPSTPLELDRRKPRFVLLQLGVRQTRLALMPIAIPSADRWDHYFETPSNPDLWGR